MSEHITDPEFNINDAIKTIKYGDSIANVKLYATGALEAALKDSTTLKAQRDELLKEILGMKYYINNPSAWDHFSQNVSDSILRLVALVDEEAANAERSEG